MKKAITLFITILIFFTCIASTLIVSAEELDYVIVQESILKTYWKEFYEYNNSQYNNYYLGVIKVGDWYYQYAKKKSTQEITAVNVCGYSGNEDEITIPVKLGGNDIFTVTEFYLMSNTVKTIHIPKEITFINGENESQQFISGEEGYGYADAKPVIRCGTNNQLEEITVDEDNQKYASQEGVLFSKNFIRLIYYPCHKSAEEYIIPNTVKYISDAAFKDVKELKRLTITPNIIELGYDSVSINCLEELRCENTQLPEYIYHMPPDMPSESSVYARYVPYVPNAIVYCIYESSLYKYYNENILYYKELKVIPRQDGESLIRENGVWYYYDNGAKTNRSTLIKHSGKWFYVSNGVWDKTFTDEIITYNGKKFYIKNGKWDSSINTLVKKNGEWLGVVNGKWDSSAKTLVKYQGKWFYIKSGKWCKDTAIVKHNGKRFYVKNGKVDFDFSGNKKINGKTYKIKNGKVA